MLSHSRLFSEKREQGKFSQSFGGCSLWKETSFVESTLQLRCSCFFCFSILTVTKKKKEKKRNQDYFYYYWKYFMPWFTSIIQYLTTLVLPLIFFFLLVMLGCGVRSVNLKIWTCGWLWPHVHCIWTWFKSRTWGKWPWPPQANRCDPQEQDV